MHTLVLALLCWELCVSSSVEKKYFDERYFLLLGFLIILYEIVWTSVMFSEISPFFEIICNLLRKPEPAHLHAKAGELSKYQTITCWLVSCHLWLGLLGGAQESCGAPARLSSIKSSRWTRSKQKQIQRQWATSKKSWKLLETIHRRLLF